MSWGCERTNPPPPSCHLSPTASVAAASAMPSAQTLDLRAAVLQCIAVDWHRHRWTAGFFCLAFAYLIAAAHHSIPSALMATFAGRRCGDAYASIQTAYPFEHRAQAAQGGVGKGVRTGCSTCCASLGGSSGHSYLRSGDNLSAKLVLTVVMSPLAHCRHAGSTFTPSGSPGPSISSAIPNVR